MAGKSICCLMDFINQLDEKTVKAQIAFYWANKDAVGIYVDDSNREFVERSMEISSKIRQYSYDCSRNVRELNSMLPKEKQFVPINIRPRDNTILIMGMDSAFHEFCMDNTSPTTRRCKRFSNPKLYKQFVPSTMLQMFSLRFTRDFSVDQQPMSIYGFVALRDDCQPLRNYIFNLERDNAFNLHRDSSFLPLTAPSRGISVWNSALIEINLKAKRNNDADACNDSVLVDVCIDFRWDRIKRGKRINSRIDGPFGTLYMDYMFIKRGVEAVVEFAIPNKFIGDQVVIIARSTWFKDEMMIYDAVVPEGNTTVSAVLAASEGGRLFVGFLSVGARAYGCAAVKVKKSGWHRGHVLACPQPELQPQPSSNLDCRLRCLALKRTSRSYHRSAEMSRAAFPPNATPSSISVPFMVTYSTMGYYTCGI